MDVRKMLADLRQERAQIDEVILSLERLETSRGRRPGRPSAALAPPRKRGRPLGSKNRALSGGTSNRRPTPVAGQPERALAAGQGGTSITATA
jgi:hypothetical protein